MNRRKMTWGLALVVGLLGCPGAWAGIQTASYNGGTVEEIPGGYRIQTGRGAWSHSPESALVYTDYGFDTYLFEVTIDPDEAKLWDYTGVFLYSREQKGGFVTQIDNVEEHNHVVFFGFYENNDRYMRCYVNKITGLELIFDSHPAGLSLGSPTAGREQPQHGTIYYRVEKSLTHLRLLARRMDGAGELLFDETLSLDDLLWGHDTHYFCVGEVDSVQGSGKADITDISMVGSLRVAIDIKPGSDPNSINLSSEGGIPVAIFSEVWFDATEIDPGTLTLSGAPVKAVGRAGRLLADREDVDGDGLLDLVVHFETARLELELEETVAVLEGETVDGMGILGEDSVNLSPGVSARDRPG